MLHNGILRCPKLLIGYCFMRGTLKIWKSRVRCRLIRVRVVLLEKSKFPPISHSSEYFSEQECLPKYLMAIWGCQMHGNLQVPEKWNFSHLFYRV